MKRALLWVVAVAESRLGTFAFATPFLVCAACTGVPGCASVPGDAGFADVRREIAERTGQEVRWNRGTAADREAADAVHRLLGDGELTADRAVRVALLDNQNLQATYEELGVAQSELVEAGLLRNPTLGFSVRFPRFQTPWFPYDLDVTQSFLELLTMPLRKRAAGAAFEAAKLARPARWSGRSPTSRPPFTGRRGPARSPTSAAAWSRPPPPRTTPPASCTKQETSPT